MNKLVYYLIMKPISMLPMGVLYFITWPFYILVAYVIRYRQRVVIINLKKSFPDKTEKEIHEIKLRFYRHFVDVLVESFKQLSISNKELERRFKIRNPELLDNNYSNGKNIALVFGHYGNWEYASALDCQMKHQVVALYKQIKNPFLNQVMRNARTRYGVQVVPTTEAGEFFRKNHKEPYLMMFLADQSPTPMSKHYWVKFLNQDTAVATGPERYAKMLDMDVVFAHIYKVHRGHYEVHLELLENNAKETQTGDITLKHVKALERNILADPAFWLWSHKRWKKKKKEGSIVIDQPS